jgi:hypothetical protein
MYRETLCGLAGLTDTLPFEVDQAGRKCVGRKLTTNIITDMIKKGIHLFMNKQ